MDAPAACLIVRNVFTHDARNERMARALRDEGYAVTVLAPLLDRSLALREERDGFVVERIDAVGGGYRAVKAIGGPRSASGTPTARSIFRKLVAPAGRTYFALQYARKAARRAVALQPALYQADHPNALLAALLASRHAAAPVIYDSQELFAHQNVPNASRARTFAVEIVERALIRRASATITVSDSIAAHLSRRYHVAPPDLIRNVPELRPLREPVEIPEVFAQPGTKLLYVGGVTRGRGIEQAIAALHALPDARLIIMGPSVAPYDGPIRDAASEFGVAGRVDFVPPVPIEDVVAVAAHATVGLVLIENVSLSYYFSLPNKLFECLHAGLPVVASDFPEIRHVVKQLDVGRTCNPADPASIAEAVHAVVDDPATLARLRKNARTAAKGFTWDRERQIYLDVVRRTMSSSTRPPA